MLLTGNTSTIACRLRSRGKGEFISQPLTPPERQSPLVLRLGVAIVSADRESMVYVNNVFVGALTQAGLDSSQRFAEFPLPAQARSTMGDWTIGIRPSPDAGKQGWDLTGAELRANEG